MKKPRKHYAPEEKVAILRRHMLEHEPISKLCDELGLQPTVFYRWQKEFFENGSQKARPNHSADQERIAYLEKKIQTKDEVLAQLMAEHVALKKRLGNSDWGLGSARHAGPDRGVRPALVGEDGDRHRAVHRMARHHRQQVLRLAGTLRQGERAQRLGSPRFLTIGVGEAGHRRVPPGEPTGVLPPG
ncbi:MAG: transposase [Bryobacterales bacterium]|nr:transposase [Bryobacterales bacterium]